MKRKILLSLVVLMLSCLVCFGAVGCDEVSNPSTLTCTKNNVEVTKILVSTADWESLYGENVHKEPGMDAIQAIKEAAFDGVTITYQKKKMEDGSAVNDGSAKTWTYADFCRKGGQVGGFNLKNKSGTITLAFEGAEVEIEYQVAGDKTGPSIGGSEQDPDQGGNGNDVIVDET